jgi:hypothetical protein
VRRLFDGMTIGRAVGLLVVSMGALSMSGRLIDPSFLTHVATGRIILDTGFPHEDPYTFTAAGEPWIAQSWLAALTYAALEDWFGLEAVRAFVAVIGGLIAGGVWVLTRPAKTLTARLLIVLPVLGIAFNGWSERPLIIGLLATVALLLAANDGLRAVWMVPIGYIWVNSHGGWPLGLGLLVLLAIGRRLDGERPAVEVRVLAYTAGGFVLGLLNPYGWRILAFPFELLQRREALSHIVEWKPPRYERPSEQLFVVLVVITAYAIARRRSWRSGLPAAAFVLLAVTGARNVLPASLVLAAAAAPCLEGFGSIESSRRTGGARLLAAASAAVVVAIATVVATGEPLDEQIYPVEADAWLRANGLSPAEHRIIAREAVGNWWEFRYGPTQLVFVDDRIEVLPLRVVEDQTALLDGVADWEQIVARYEPEAIVWEVDRPLADQLGESTRWQVTHRDDRYVVAVPTGS